MKTPFEEEEANLYWVGEEETSSPEADLLSDDDERGAQVDRTPSCKDREGVANAVQQQVPIAGSANIRYSRQSERLPRQRERERRHREDEYVLSVGRLNEEGELVERKTR